MTACLHIRTKRKLKNEANNQMLQVSLQKKEDAAISKSCKTLE